MVNLVDRKIICLCLDVSEKDIIDTIKEGYDHMELVKRYTGVFMGPCQGKMCSINTLKIFCKITNTKIEDMKIPTLRPPVRPVPLGIFSGEEWDYFKWANAAVNRATGIL